MKFIKFLTVGLVVGCVVLGILFFALNFWSDSVSEKEEQNAFVWARELLDNDDPVASLEVIREHRHPETGLAWEQLEFKALIQARNVVDLSLLYQKDPLKVLADEQASLLLARAFFSGQQMEDFKKVRDHWKGQETQKASWTFLDADILSLSGEQDNAINLLNGTSLTNSDEASRLTRLAILLAEKDIYKSYDLLSEAVEIAPKDPDVRSFRGQILEKLGKKELARIEYVAALVAQPKNPMLGDQLADFYRRQNNFDLAIRTWQETLSKSPLDYLALKTKFWSKVVLSENKTIQPITIERGALKPTVQWMSQLDHHEFWNETSYNQLPQPHLYLEERQELTWLKIVHHLKNQDEKSAYKLLLSNKFKKNSVQPELELALQRVLNFRLNNEIFSNWDSENIQPLSSHQFFDEIQNWAKSVTNGNPLSPESSLVQFVQSPQIFTGLFMAAGWREVALVLDNGNDAASEMPEWFVYGLAQCKRYNRGLMDAVVYLSSNAKTPKLKLLKAEMLLAAEKNNEGLALLELLSKDDSSVGFRSSWILSLAYMDMAEYNKALSVINANRSLANHTNGIEIKARIAVIQNKLQDAANLYASIVNDSIEAQAFLAKISYQQKNWKQAAQLTEASLNVLPDSMELRKNIQLIRAKEDVK